MSKIKKKLFEFRIRNKKSDSANWYEINLKRKDVHMWWEVQENIKRWWKSWGSRERRNSTSFLHLAYSRLLSFAVHLGGIKRKQMAFQWSDMFNEILWIFYRWHCLMDWFYTQLILGLEIVTCSQAVTYFDFHWTSESFVHFESVINRHFVKQGIKIYPLYNSKIFEWNH
jgi:hypothetical protein